MFKLECFVDDKHLALVLHALAGKALNLKTTPVINVAVAANGDVHPATRGGALDLFKNWLKEKNLTVISHAHVKQFQLDMGRASGGAGYIIKKGIEHKILKRSKQVRGTPKSKMTYDVIDTTTD